MEKYKALTNLKTKHSYNLSIPKLNFRFNAILVKFPAGLFVEIDKFIIKYILKFKILRIAKIIFKIITK